MLQPKNKKIKVTSIILILTIILQFIIPIIPEIQTEVLAAEETNKEEQSTQEENQAEEISRNYEIKEEETWDISENGDGSVTAKWTLKDRTLTISGTGKMKEWEVNSIEDWHNSQYTKLIENVIIKEGITNIGKYAFYECNNLSNINVPEGVTSIGYRAFFECTNLTSINIPKEVTIIKESAFYNCEKLTSITIPEGVISIEYNVFNGCTSLEEIEVNIENPNYLSENGVLFNKEKTKIIKYPEGKKDIKEYIIPNEVSSIESLAFKGCSNLTSITIPEGVTNIESSAFQGCSSLININIPEGITNIENATFSGCSSLTNINIPEGVTSIGSLAFQECSNLTSITIPEKVTNIESSAFQGCSNLVNINIPEGITSIKSYTFKGCSKLTNITIPEKVTEIGKSAFSECTSLTNIIIPEGVTSIGEEAFSKCTNLKDITIPAEVTNIGEKAFNECTNLTNITIPEEVTSIGDSAIPKTTIIYAKADSVGHKYAEESAQGYFLEGEPSTISTKYEIKEEETWDISAYTEGKIIAKWTLSDKTLRITGTGEMKTLGIGSREDWWRTQYTNLIENVIISDGITNIGSYAFEGFRNLQSITIPEEVTEIGMAAFSGCRSLKNINIPEEVTYIGEEAFRECESLTDIKIPEGVTTIKDLTFYGCSNLKNITIPKTVTSLEYNIFGGCESLTNITIPEGVTTIENDTLIDLSSLENIEVDINNTNFTSENGILFNKEKTKIIKYPEGKKDIEEYTIPEGVTSIGDRAFYKCNNLSNINIPEGVTGIGDRTFYECNNLSNINIPEGITSIGELEFYGCDSLINITIPESVTSIGEGAFRECINLTNITIPRGVTNIDNTTFYGCTGLTNITIPEGVTNIENIAFEECSNLNSIIIPKSVTSIGENSIPKTTIIYTKSNTEAHRYAEESKQGYIIDDTEPTVTYTPNGETNPQKEYSTKIEVKDNLEEIGINENSLKYQWTQSTEEPSKESFTESFENGQTITKNTGDGNWYLWVYAKDNIGNEAITRSEAFNFDNTAPTINIEYSTKNPTNKDVKVTIKANEQIQNIEGWTISEDKLSLTKTYSENTEEAITIKDLAGNEANATIEISNIDKTLKYEIGDINNDGKIDITDLLMLKRHITAGSRTEWILTGNSLTAADMNEDENVDITDMLMLKRKITEEI